MVRYNSCDRMSVLVPTRTPLVGLVVVLVSRVVTRRVSAATLTEKLSPRSEGHCTLPKVHEYVLIPVHQFTTFHEHTLGQAPWSLQP